MKHITPLKMTITNKETGEETVFKKGDKGFPDRAYLVKQTDNEIANKAAIKSISNRN